MEDKHELAPSLQSIDEKQWQGFLDDLNCAYGHGLAGRPVLGNTLIHIAGSVDYPGDVRNAALFTLIEGGRNSQHSINMMLYDSDAQEVKELEEDLALVFSRDKAQAVYAVELASLLCVGISSAARTYYENGSALALLVGVDFIMDTEGLVASAAEAAFALSAARTGPFDDFGDVADRTLAKIIVSPKVSAEQKTALFREESLADGTVEVFRRPFNNVLLHSVGMIGAVIDMREIDTSLVNTGLEDICGRTPNDPSVSRCMPIGVECIVGLERTIGAAHPLIDMVLEDRRMHSPRMNSSILAGGIEYLKKEVPRIEDEGLRSNVQTIIREAELRDVSNGLERDQTINDANVRVNAFLSSIKQD